MTNNFRLFTPDEELLILEDFIDIAQSDKKNALKYPIEKFINATKGMYLDNNRGDKKVKKNVMYLEILDTYNSDNIPMVRPDSITAWGNQAAIQFGLEIRDIVGLKTGDKLRLIFMDRNVGDYNYGKKKGDKCDPLKEGFTYATYKHDKNLNGSLKWDYIDELVCFEWEVNYPCKECFWGPIPKNMTHKDYDPRTKVGWRGPAIDINNCKYLPKYYVHYDTWWDDYLPFKYKNFLDIPRV